MEEESNLTREAVEAMLLGHELTPLSELQAESFDPKMHLNLREYLFRQTPWGLRENLKGIRRESAKRLAAREVDIEAYRRE